MTLEAFWAEVESLKTFIPAPCKEYSSDTGVSSRSGSKHKYGDIRAAKRKGRQLRLRRAGGERSSHVLEIFWR